MALLGHLLTDRIANPVVPFGYFFTYRAIKRFRRDSIVKVKWSELEEDFLRNTCFPESPLDLQSQAQGDEIAGRLFA